MPGRVRVFGGRKAITSVYIPDHLLALGEVSRATTSPCSAHVAESGGERVVWSEEAQR